METIETKGYYETLATEKNIWNESKKSNYYYKEHSRIDAILKRLPKGKLEILDLGCGDGYLSCKIAERGFNVTCIDLSQNRLDKFKDQAGKLNIKQVLGDVTKVELPADSFDVIVCSEVIEHLPNFKEVLAEAFRLLKKGGYFIVTVPNDEKLKMISCPHCLKHFFRDDHVNSFNKGSLSAHLKEAGFSIDDITVTTSKILNQFQYHLKPAYGIMVKTIDWILSRLFNKYTFYLLIRAGK